MTANPVSRKVSRLMRDEQGGPLAEFALVLPLLLLLVFGTMEFANVLYQQHIITKGAQEAARFAARSPALVTSSCGEHCRNRPDVWWSPDYSQFVSRGRYHYGRVPIFCRFDFLESGQRSNSGRSGDRFDQLPQSRISWPSSFVRLQPERPAP